MRTTKGYLNSTRTKRTGLACCVAAAMIGMVANSRGAGMLKADGGLGGRLEIVEHNVDVTVNNGIAVTKVRQAFLNKERRQVEALYSFPIPRGASVANFSMWIGGKEMIGEVVEKERAREIYNSYKAVRRDPGLLEQNNYKTFEMRIFPIEAGATQRVEVTYYQELDVDHDRSTYVYPLATSTEGEDSRVNGQFRFNMHVKSAIPLVGVDSPSHGQECAIAQHQDVYAQIAMESGEGNLAKDVVVSWQLRRPNTGLDMVTSKTEGEDGYFYLTLTSGDEDLAKLEKGMDYVFLLDVSGSMRYDQKMEVSRQSIFSFIRALAPEDRFELLTFNIAPNTLFNQATPVTEEALQKAEAFLEQARTGGGTVLKPALDAAYRYGEPDRPLNVVVLSDGMTDPGEVKELQQLIRSRPAHVRVFCIGVGNDVNKPLLEQLAQETGGLAAFISRGDNFDRQAQAFRRKLMRPGIANLAISFNGVKVYDVEPVELPALYHGSPVRIYGRYQGGGTADVTIQGDIMGRSLKRSVQMEFPERDDANPEIERMWAWKRIDRLLKTADRDGSRKDVLSEIIALGETYSIVTEYTSFLVLENDGEFQRWKIERRNQQRAGRDRAAQVRVQEQLARLREKNFSDLGPQALENPPAKPATAPVAQPQTIQNRSVPAVPPPMVADRRPTQSRDLMNFGSSPVGPLFVLFALWLRKKQKTAYA